jgi:hypothetical protein
MEPQNRPGGKFRHGREPSRRRLMAKPVLLVTRKLPEAIEARAAQDYDARLNPQDAPWATDGAEIARRATEASAAGILGAAGASIPSASMPCRLA